MSTEGVPEKKPQTKAEILARIKQQAKKAAGGVVPPDSGRPTQATPVQETHASMPTQPLEPEPLRGPGGGIIGSPNEPLIDPNLADAKGKIPENFEDLYKKRGDSEELRDPLYADAVKVVFEMGKASISILQRRLRLGYGRAAKILDAMCAYKVIAKAEGPRPREVLLNPEEQQTYLASLETKTKSASTSEQKVEGKTNLAGETFRVGEKVWRRGFLGHVYKCEILNLNYKFEDEDFVQVIDVDSGTPTTTKIDDLSHEKPETAKQDESWTIPPPAPAPAPEPEPPAPPATPPGEVRAETPEEREGAREKRLAEIEKELAEIDALLGSVEENPFSKLGKNVGGSLEELEKIKRETEKEMGGLGWWKRFRTFGGAKAGLQERLEKIESAIARKKEIEEDKKKNPFKYFLIDQMNNQTFLFIFLKNREHVSLKELNKRLGENGSKGDWLLHYDHVENGILECSMNGFVLEPPITPPGATYKNVKNIINGHFFVKNQLGVIIATETNYENAHYLLRQVATEYQTNQKRIFEEKFGKIS